MHHFSEMMINFCAQFRYLQDFCLLLIDFPHFFDILTPILGPPPTPHLIDKPMDFVFKAVWPLSVAFFVVTHRGKTCFPWLLEIGIVVMKNDIAHRCQDGI